MSDPTIESLKDDLTVLHERVNHLSAQNMLQQTLIQVLVSLSANTTADPLAQIKSIRFTVERVVNAGLGANADTRDINNDLITQTNELFDSLEG